MACDRPNYLLRHSMGEFLSFLFNRIECRNYKLIRYKFTSSTNYGYILTISKREFILSYTV